MKYSKLWGRKQHEHDSYTIISRHPLVISEGSQVLAWANHINGLCIMGYSIVTLNRGVMTAETDESRQNTISGSLGLSFGALWTLVWSGIVAKLYGITVNLSRAQMIEGKAEQFALSILTVEEINTLKNNLRDSRCAQVRHALQLGKLAGALRTRNDCYARVADGTQV